MAITPVTANPPAENVDPWYAARTAFDNQLKATTNAAAALADAHEAQKAAANGLATLGADSKLPAAQLPAIALVEYLGASANQAAMLAKVGQPGDWTIRTDLSTTWVQTGTNPALLASWTQLSYPTAPVTTVAGRTGAVVLAQADITGLVAALGDKASIVQLNAAVAALEARDPLVLTYAQAIPVGTLADRIIVRKAP